MSEPFSKCCDCGCDLEDGEVYGEWDDLCKECDNDRNDEDEE